MRHFIFIFCFFSLMDISAQGKIDSTKFRPHYMGMMLSGMQIGCNDCTLGKRLTASAYLINGVQLSKRFSVGVGIGADGYDHWKTMPLFLHLSERISGNKNGLLIQLNAGHAWAWWDVNENNLPNFNQQGGVMIHPAITYYVNLEKWKIFFSVGFKTQVASYSYRYDYRYTVSPVNGNKDTFSEYTVKNDLNRAVFQIGFGWR